MDKRYNFKGVRNKANNQIWLYGFHAVKDVLLTKRQIYKLIITDKVKNKLLADDNYQKIQGILLFHRSFYKYDVILCIFLINYQVYIPRNTENY